MLDAMQWRAMTADEIATRPEARLGGALAWMFWLALAIGIVPPLGLGLDLAFLYTGSIHGGPGVWLIGFYGGPVDVGWPYMVSVIFIVLGSLVFVVMTVMRAQSTPTTASIGIVIWVVLRSTFGYAPYLLAAQDPLYTWPYAASLATEAIMAAAFCGYMATGVRPNAYYRRRLPG